MIFSVNNLSVGIIIVLYDYVSCATDFGHFFDRGLV